MQKLTHERIVMRQLEKSRTPRYPLTVILDSIRSLHNVGAIFRTADGVGVEKIYLCGITGYPPQGEIAKTALGAEESVPWQYVQDVVKAVEELKAKGYEIVVLEQAQESIDYEDFKPTRPVCLVVGNELEGVSDHVMSLADRAIEIEMKGIKNSLNVAVAFGVVAFAIRTRLKQGV